MTAIAEQTREAVNHKVLQLLKDSNEGMPAEELAEQIQQEQRLSKSDIAAIIRSLMERGEVVIGPRLRLVIRR